ncbi:MAG: ABC transporter permease [Bryobacteraceae bacterium]
MTSISLRLYRTLARAFPYDFKNAYGDQLTHVTEEAIEGIWRRYGLLGLARLLLDLAIRIPAEHLAEFGQDLRYGLRMLAGAPGFTAVALISLTLGIGIATAAFSEMNGFVMRDVPAVRDPGGLVLFKSPVAYPDYKRYRDRTDLFSTTMAYMAAVPLGVSLGGRTERVWGHLVTASYFSTLGVEPALGHWFAAAEEQPGHAPNVAVSYRFWRNYLGFDPAIIGKVLRVNGQPCTITAVGPEEFQGASPMAYVADLWLPVGAGAGVAPELAGDVLERHDRAAFMLLGRLKPGVPEGQAEAALDAMARQIEREQSDPNRDRPGRRVQLHPGGKLVPMKKEDLPAIAGFFAVLGGVILLIASSNVANMMMARAADRRKEISIRLALGAGRARLIRQLLTESLVLAAAAGAMGYAFAWALMRLASQETIPYPVPPTINLEPDGRVMLFTFVLTAFTALACGLIPALQTTRPDLTTALKEGGNIQLRRFRRLSLRNGLVVSQVAGSLALLLITGFLVIGHQRMMGGEIGFDPARLYLLSLDPVRDGYTPARTADFLPKMLDRVKRLPSVTAAALADSVPMAMIAKPRVTFAVDTPGGPKAVFQGSRFGVGRDFYDTIGIAILRGRGLRQEDEKEGVTAAVVSEKTARVCWPGQDPLGRRIVIGAEDMVQGFLFGPGAPGGGGQGPQLTGRTQVFQVVGVARNVRDGLSMVATDAPPEIYVPLRPADYARPTLQGIALLMRANPGVDVIAAARREIETMDNTIKPFNPRSMTGQIDTLLFPVSVALYTYGVIGICGLILASVGLAGVTAYSVTQRRREIGIRLALGARTADVLRLVMKEGLVLIVIGSAIGLLLARAGIRALSSALNMIARTAGNTTNDPTLLIGAPLLLAILALGACYVPARRSTAVDPAVTLRQE